MNACCRWWNLEYRYRKLHDYVRYYPIAVVAEKYFATFRNSAGLQTEDIAEVESSREEEPQFNNDNVPRYQPW